MEVVNLDLGAHTYNIYIGENLLENGELLRSAISGKEVLIVTNDVVKALYLERLQKSLYGLKVDCVVLPDGEEFKTLDSFNQVITHLLAQGHKRSTTVIALGGGVVGDTAGFAAASYQRGVNFVQIPTTLLAQVDSSVGGKTAVNHELGKNMLGAFHQPKAVFIDTSTLATLPDRELSAGLAEVIKHGALADRDYFEDLETCMPSLLLRNPETLARIIRRSCEIKARIVAADERESGVRALLNLGHTFGHAIETAMGYGVWLHGQAVGAGMVMAADLSWRLGLLDLQEARRLRALIEAAGLPVAPPPGMGNSFMSLMARDKKATDKGLRFILLKSLGEAIIADNVDDAKLLETISAGSDLLT